MRFLVDESLSWKLARELAVAGHDAVHVYDIELGGCEDSQILLEAGKSSRIVISEDTDFGTLMAMQRLSAPSILLFRVVTTDPSQLAQMVLKQLPSIEKSLAAGAVIVITDSFIRIRRLPIGSWEEK